MKPRGREAAPAFVRAAGTKDFPNYNFALQEKLATLRNAMCSPKTGPPGGPLFETTSPASAADLGPPLGSLRGYLLGCSLASLSKAYSCLTRAHSGVALGSLRARPRSGFTLGALWLTSRRALGSLWARSGLALGSRCARSGLALASLWAPSGLTPGSLWVRSIHSGFTWTTQNSPEQPRTTQANPEQPRTI